MDIKQVLINTLSNVGLWSAICSTIIIIFLGFILFRFNVFKKEWKGALNTIVLKVALPALAFTGFMKPISIEELKSNGIILGLSFAFYGILSLIAYVWVKYFNYLVPKRFRVNKLQTNITDNSGVITNIVKDDMNVENVTEYVSRRSLVMWMMLIFGSITSFGLPVIKQMYEAEGGVIAANIWTIPFRIFLYSYCLMLMSNVKFSKETIKSSMKTIFLNPVVILTFLGLILWLTQLIPGASSFNQNFKYGTHGWFELKVTMPYIYQPINMLSAIMSPLIWFSIGITLAEANIKSAAKDRWVWIFSFQKLILIPLVIFSLMIPFVSNGSISKGVAISMVIFAAVPPATVVNAFSIQFKVCEKFASQCSALTTLLAIIAIPLWIVISDLTYSLL